MHYAYSLMVITPFFPPAPQLLEVAHVAHRLGFSQDHVRDLLQRKQLAAVRIGRRWRVDPADLEAFIDAQRVPSDDRERQRAEA